MTGTPGREPGTDATAPSRTTQALFYVAYVVMLLVLFGGAAELVVRAQGFAPWSAENASVSSIQVEPGGKLFQTHQTLGYSHIPGSFVVAMGMPGETTEGGADRRRLRFEMTHLPDTLRVTRPLETYTAADDREQVWLFGCSYTHGWSVTDDETYAWLLQERFQDHAVVNFGVSGYGTIHSLLQFREALKTRTPSVAVLAYADFHDERNTFARIRRKLIAPWNRLGPLVQPYARLDGDGRLRFEVADVEYREFPMMRQLALAHYIETKYDQYETERLRSREVSQALILEMAALAKQHGVAFVVATINGRPMADFYAEHGLTHVDMSVDPRRPENTNLPFDSHPSALAHARYAATLEPLLRRTLQPAD